MNADGNSHQHMLGPLYDFAVDLEQITPLQSFEAKVLVAEIAVVDNSRVQTIRVCHDDFVVLLRDHGSWTPVGLHLVQILDHLAEHLLGLLMQIGDDDPEVGEKKNTFP